MQNWRTTLTGIGCGFLNLWGAGALQGAADFADFGVSAAIAIFGFLAKDFRVSGTKDPGHAGEP
jgi:hypothetical protein